ncbi:NB-ARC domains-containing protein [Tanacetum coccineum]
MAAPSNPHRWKYDVFVSFRGEDIRRNFMDHLFNDFKQKGIFAFRDDSELPKGEEISPHLYKAIEESRFLIVIFSKNYASSSWCLRELVKILECKQIENPKYEVRIIFYDAKPDVVRKQKRSYAEAFRNHEVSNSVEVGKWKEALSMAANLSGFDLQDMTNGLNLSRFVGSDKVNMIGICEVTNKTRADSSPTRKCLKTIMKIEDLKISSVGEGIMVIKKMMSSKPILLVLDDVDHRDQLKALAGSANTNMRVLVDKSLITISSNMSLQMHDLIQAMARAIVAETEAVEVLVLLLEKFSQKVCIDSNDFAHMKKLRILKIYQEEKVYEQKLFEKLSEQKHELKGHNVIFSGNLYYLSNELRLFYWHGCPFKYLPSDFYPENIVAIDLSYSNIKHFWTSPKCFRRLKVMKLRYCCNLTTTPDFSEITNLEELSLEGCVNLVSVHPSIGMLKRLVVLNLTGCLKVDQLPEALGRIKSLTELHVDRTAITELPSFVSSLKNLESLSFGGQGRIQPRWWTSITRPFGFIWNQQHPQRSVSLAGLRMLKSLNLSYCNLLEVPDSIGGLSFLEYLKLDGNNFTNLPGSLRQLSSLKWLNVDGCKKLEVLPELPTSVRNIYASHCTSLREVSGSSKDLLSSRYTYFRNCLQLFNNVTIDSEGSISKTQCLDSSITSQGFIHQLSAFLGYLGLQTNNRCQFFSQNKGYSDLDIVYHGNSMPEWFTNRITENLVKVELPSDKIRGFGTCVVFKCKKPHKCIYKGYTVKNFDGALITTYYFPSVLEQFWKDEVIGIHDSYMMWLHYTKYLRKWNKAKNFVTFSFVENNEDYEVKECGVRLICDEDIKQEADLSIFQGLPTPTQHGGMLGLTGPGAHSYWSW